MVRVRSNIGSEAEKWLKEQEVDLRGAVMLAMKRTQLTGEARIKGIIEKEAHDTGRFLRSITSNISTEADQIILAIGTNLEYAVAIEEGRKPGKWPNLNALVKWVGRKLREKGINARVNITFDQLKAMARSGNGKKKKKNSEAVIARQHLAMLYLVGRKIATKGIRQKLIFKRIEAGLQAYLADQIAKEIKAL